jgi:signal transduction histidine kinase
VEVGGQKLYTIILRDITERKRAEEELRASREQLRALAGRLLTIREEEGARLARQLDESLGQALAGLKFDLAWLASRLSADQGALLERLRELLPMADAMISAVRQIGTELRPGILDVLGLVAALEWQAQEFQKRTGIRCEFISEQRDIPLHPEASTALFRICQEALTNASRHAHATQVHLGLREEAGTLVLTVGDNGVGITEQNLAYRTSLGLLGMRERALRLGGEVAIVGRRREGTTVTVRLPLSQAISQAAPEDQSR